jgi:transcriptional antiterminator RfaH
MLDAATVPTVALPHQDTATPHASCHAPCGCRPASWHVVATKPRAERIAHAALHLRGYQPYLPLVTVRRADRTWHTRPLFPGYLFIQLGLGQPYYPIAWAPGVYHLLSTAGKPTICPGSVVNLLQASEALRAAPIDPAHQWQPGVPCQLTAGPFQGHSAVIISTRHRSARVALMCFGHLREIAVNFDCLQPRCDG